MLGKGTGSLLTILSASEVVVPLQVIHNSVSGLLDGVDHELVDHVLPPQVGCDLPLLPIVLTGFQFI